MPNTRIDLQKVVNYFDNELYRPTGRPGYESLDPIVKPSYGRKYAPLIAWTFFVNSVLTGFGTLIYEKLGARGADQIPPTFLTPEWLNYKLAGPSSYVVNIILAIYLTHIFGAHVTSFQRHRKATQNLLQDGAFLDEHNRNKELKLNLVRAGVKNALSMGLSIWTGYTSYSVAVNDGWNSLTQYMVWAEHAVQPYDGAEFIVGGAINRLTPKNYAELEKTIDRLDQYKQDLLNRVKTVPRSFNGKSVGDYIKDEISGYRLTRTEMQSLSCCCFWSLLGQWAVILAMQTSLAISNTGYCNSAITTVQKEVVSGDWGIGLGVVSWIPFHMLGMLFAYRTALKLTTFVIGLVTTQRCAPRAIIDPKTNPEADPEAQLPPSDGKSANVQPQLAAQASKCDLYAPLVAQVITLAIGYYFCWYTGGTVTALNKDIQNAFIFNIVTSLVGRYFACFGNALFNGVCIMDPVAYAHEKLVMKTLSYETNRVINAIDETKGYLEFLKTNAVRVKGDNLVIKEDIQSKREGSQMSRMSASLMNGSRQQSQVGTSSSAAPGLSRVSPTLSMGSSVR